MKIVSKFVFWLTVFVVPGSMFSAAQNLSARAGNAASVAKAAKPAGEHPAMQPADRFDVGPGDVLKISVWKEPELSQTVAVRPDGHISLPLVHDLDVHGKTTGEIESALAGMLQSFIVDPQVSVNLVEIHSKTAYITGEVGKPGAYPLTGPIDVLQLIAKAGGLTQYAKRKSILLIRSDEKGEHRYKLDYRDFVSGKTNPKSQLLQAGDTVVVP